MGILKRRTQVSKLIGYNSEYSRLQTMSRMCRRREVQNTTNKKIWLRWIKKHLENGQEQRAFTVR